MDPPVTFGGWLFQSRQQLGLTRKELAGRVGCSIAALRKIEDGERRPSVQIADLIANCLNVAPEQRSTFVRVARGELSVDRLLPESTPVATKITAPTTNLPVFPTPLIGRERQVEQLSQFLRDPRCRLLTLVGPGGIGKTRLAIEMASRMQAVFADGVFFVPFASANSTRLILPVIADAVGFAFQSAGDADPKTQLFGYLREKEALLLTDNLEQLLAEPGIEMLAELLARAPQVKLLATSRECLGLQEEWVFEVQGLPVPEHISAEGSAENTSVELFLQRARRAHVGFDVTAETLPAIARICQLVEGNPLGIELAAAWVRTLTCEEIAQEISHGLDVLSLSARDIPARHRSMRAVFDHSWKLLMEEEQRVLLRLSVFHGGFKREAANAVAGATLSVLSTLVTKSLIRRTGGGRYDLHELIHQFAAQLLVERPEEQTATRTRHGKYFLTYFSQADGRLRSSAQGEALVELTSEMDNFRAAWDWAVTHGEFAMIEQSMRTFYMLYDTRGWFQEGLDTLSRAVNALEKAHGHLPPDRTEQVALGHLLNIYGWLAYRLADYAQAQRMLERSMNMLRPLNARHVLVESVTYLGMLLEMMGNYVRAFELYSEGLRIASGIGDQWFKALCLTCVNGLVANTRLTVAVKPEDAHELLRSAVADWRLIGDPRMIGFGLRILSQSASVLGRYAEARSALEESVALNSSVGDRWGLGSAYRGLGVIAGAQGDHSQAVDMFRESLDTFTELGASWWVARVLAEMGESILALGDDTKAVRVWREALRLATGIHGTPVALKALVGLAVLQAKRGLAQTALEMLLVVLNHPASNQETKDRAEILCTELKTRLTSQQIEMAQTQARTHSFNQVVTHVLEPPL